MLGLWLVEQEIITDEALDNALRIQLQSGGRLGDILIAEGATTPLKLYQAIASHAELPFINLLKDDWDRTLLIAENLQNYIRLRYLPVSISDEYMTVATPEPFDPQLEPLLRKRYQKEINFVVTSPFDIRRTIEQHFEGSLTEHSQNRLARLAPEHSAYRIVNENQRYGFAFLFIFVVALFYHMPYETFAFSLLIANLLYVLALVFKVLVFIAGIKKSPFLPPVSPIPENELPSFTILVPLYMEAENVADILGSLNALNYPKHKLDIKLVLEADDADTIDAAIYCKPSYQFDIIRVPQSEIRTKPKACNYALAFARGDIVTIYDAEDRPDINQLKMVAELFDALPTDVTCVQAKLRFDNAHENWLTRFFDIEYAVLFEHLLPGLEKLRMPIPLGGTSNHIHAELLREIGEWDPYNVTEDADLGVRLAAMGFRTRTIPSITYEECPIAIRAWMRQRSRWIKGHLQTWLVFMRDPLRLMRTLGVHGFLGFHMFLGLPYILFLTAPYVFLLSMLWQFGVFQDVLPASLGYLMYGNLIAYFVLHWIQGFYVAFSMVKPRDKQIAARKLKLKEASSALLFPFYWLFHIVASFYALQQLICRPHHWMKTKHGVSLKRIEA